MRWNIPKGMSFMATSRNTFERLAAKADAERYRRYAEAKSKIPLNLPPAKYEEEVKRLAKKYGI